MKEFSNYRCLVENKFGNDQKSFIIDPEFSPEFVKDFETIKFVPLKVGQRDQNLLCQIQSRPKAIMSWTMVK